ncbi:MAG: hypothetical protein O3B73_03655 [bacterium]|nr:hypothetical protein [bacterium]
MKTRLNNIPSGTFGSWARLLAGLVVCLIGLGCGSSAPDWTPPGSLSEFGFFETIGATKTLAGGVISYDINTPLFSDYTLKYRYVKLPPNARAKYDPVSPFELPVGTLIAKTFAYPVDMRDLSKGQRLLETRVLVLRPNGWVGLPYIWNEAQTDAALEIAGEVLPASWIHADGQPRFNEYLVPNVNQCKQCHDQHGQLKPIGIRAKHLNREYPYKTGAENQLAYWTRMGMLDGAPPPEEAPRLAMWHDAANATVDARARAWLDINCAHCHSPEGRAWSAGLDLTSTQTDSSLIGIYKTSTAAGAGTGGRDYDVVPGDPDASIFPFRIASTQPDVAMPELGRRLVHAEGLALIELWIAEMPSP